MGKHRDEDNQEQTMHDLQEQTPTTTMQNRFAGGPRGSGWARLPPQSHIASDLRFAIQITNHNRNNILRFGTLSLEVYCNTFLQYILQM